MVYHNSFYAMGTRFTLVLPDMDEDQAAQIFMLVRDEVRRMEGKLSRFMDKSEVAIVNRLAVKEAVPLSDEVFGVLQQCQYFTQCTRGAFDITLRPLMTYWNGRAAEQVEPEKLSECMSHIGPEAIHLDKEHKTVRFSGPGVEIDLGGYGKGYALESVRVMLKRFGVRDAFVSFGESSVLTLGSHPAGDHWKVGINNYQKPGEALHTFALNEGSVSTSSNFYLDDSGTLINHRHVINPFSGYPVEECTAVSVSAPSAETAEALSTALLVGEESLADHIRAQTGPCEILKVVYTEQGPEIRLL